MFKTRFTTLAAALVATLGASGAVLAVSPIASADRPASIATATDDHNRGQAEPGDDNGVLAEPGDDKGVLAEPCDDAGVLAEPGDDNGIHAQSGDDKNRQLRASAVAKKATTATKSRHEKHLRRTSRRAEKS